MGAIQIRKNLENGLIVKEPIKEIHQKINENDQVVTLKGVKGSGKSTVLLSKSETNLKENDFSIYHNFENTGVNILSDKTKMNIITHRFELEMTSILLQTLKEYGIVTQKDEIIKKELDYYLKEWFRYLKSYSNVDKFTSPTVPYGYYTEDLATEIKNIFKIDKLNLLADNSDWIFERNSQTQENISKYFSLFDKVVLTTTDENYSSSYPTIEVNYGKDFEVVKEIVKRYLNSINQNLCFPEEILNNLIIKANGDIESILFVIKHNLYLFEYKHLTENAIANTFDQNIDRKVLARKEYNEYKRIQRLNPKFYI